MSESKEQKEARLRTTAQKAVAELLSVSEAQYGKVIAEQCHRVAVEVGNMLAPQMYGNRVHGVGNAVSVCVRHCSEALFWLDMTQDKPKDVVSAVEDLLQCLSSPVL
jgi:hypothetical protein